MAVKTNLTLEEIQKMLSDYSIGQLLSASPISEGTVQTNYKITTSQGFYVLRYYENRTFRQVLFELELLESLKEKRFPCAFPVFPKDQRLLCYRGKPYAVYQWVEGISVEFPNIQQQESLIHLIAALGKATTGFSSQYAGDRLNYSIENCGKLAESKAAELGTWEAAKKMKWLKQELNRLQLPAVMSQSVCHCDYHYTNILYQEDEITALIDFDDANCTYRYFDLISIMDFWKSGFDHETWSSFDSREEILDFCQPKQVLERFQKYEQIPLPDRQHFFDLLKLSILFDCIWYFSRGHEKDFFEKRKIEALNRMGREEFYKRLFKDF